MTVFLDPWSLAWRGDFLSQEQAEGYVERLTEIFDLSTHDCVSLVISDESAELLIADDAYPLIRRLPEPLWPNRSDVYRLVATLCEKLPKLTQTGIGAVLIDDVNRDPEISFACSARHASHIDELAATSLVASERSKIPLSTILSSYATAGETHKFRMSVEDVDCVCPPVARIGLYEGEIQFRPNLTSCLSDWNAADLLARGFVERAIALSVWKGSGMRSGDPFAKNGWILGVNFERSIGESGIATNKARVEALLRTCRNVLLVPDLRTTHALRENSSGNSPQRTRDRDKAMAWRADIDDEYHLHYWVGSAGVEFADVVTHNNFYISA